MCINTFSFIVLINILRKDHVLNTRMKKRMPIIVLYRHVLDTDLIIIRVVDPLPYDVLTCTLERRGVDLEV